MKNFLYSIAFGFMVFICGCTADPNVGLSQGNIASNRVASQSGRRIAEKYGLHFCGLGGGEDKGIWLIMAVFQRFGEPLTEMEARRLIVNCTDEFLADINANEEIKPFLKVYPFTTKNIGISLVTYGLSGEEQNDPYIDTMGFQKGSLLYMTHKRDSNKVLQTNSIKWETYEEAKAILAQEQING